MTERVDRLSIMYMEKDKEFELLKRQYETLQEAYDQEKKSLLEEIDSAKSKSESLAKQVKTLQSHLHEANSRFTQPDAN
jgi:chromosome segregation ATPase